MKRFVTRSSEPHSIEGYSVAEAVVLLKVLVNTVGPDAEISFECNYEGDTDFRVTYVTEETDAEYAHRTSIMSRVEDAERREYARLKAKYGS